jgi:hypothetical protein
LSPWSEIEPPSLLGGGVALSVEVDFSLLTPGTAAEMSVSGPVMISCFHVSMARINTESAPDVIFFETC